MLIGLVGRIGTDRFDFGMMKTTTPGRPDKMGWYRDPLARFRAELQCIVNPFHPCPIVL
jgi:hypothetical protein